MTEAIEASALDQKLAQILSLERIDRDIFRGDAVPSRLPRTFGGQVAAQALMAAVNTVPEDRIPHSLHGYFLRPGRPHEPTVFTVGRVRDGGSFTTREVHAIQDGETIFAMTASFQVHTDGVEHQDEMPGVPAPEECAAPPTWQYFAEEWPDWDVRRVPREALVDADRALARQRVWIRHREPLPDSRALHIGGLAYLSDMTLLMAARGPHGGLKTQAKVASLDHAVWIMRPFRVDEWLLYDQISPSAQGGRALVQGKLFDQSGRLVAAVAQEGGIKLVPGEAGKPTWIKP
ncbi:acyl-CoA thioesterase [Segniliparus rugosus]|uniref:Acyl-CoA thioesterase 2 n=1 Tax=Segniliparus rugosus (strain ATCC BAA-974 / DSM 45345 / CCUG 50838 / CIP 108380 / JCM 13579 / CDC 945) TaxID=679197 RepID=E5XSR3_SEGRC|nr:acyl-CoA thioesterase II [Segniliparus rugosus]EFV12590.1 acyl-CoA thioesterase II [Segniliparus rugosus ATCC BAA-974]